MSEQPAEVTATEPEASTTEPNQHADEQQPKPTETVDFWKQKAREQEKRAKENADAAKRLSEIEDSQKSEMEKLNDRTAKAEAKAAEVELRALRAEVAADKGIPASLLSGSTLDELTASADALIAFRGEKPKPDFGGGDRGSDVGDKGKQITSKVDLDSMTPAEINKARREGRLNDLLRK